MEKTQIMLINIFCAKCIGIQAVPVTVEVDISNGIGIHLVGLADIAVKESLLRIMTALQSLGFRIPGRKTVINLAPADVRKNGSGYDLPIAIGIIAASGQCEMTSLDKYLIMGELGLDGSVRPVPGAIPIVEFAAQSGFEGCILPLESAHEASELTDIKIYGVRNLNEVLKILTDSREKDSLIVEYTDSQETCPIIGAADGKADYMNFKDIAGQETAKRGVEIAVAGSHNVIMVGSPGSGKTSLAKAIIGIIPAMHKAEAIETSKIYSISGIGSTAQGLIRKRPFRAPHYSASLAAIIGGGNGDNIMPGEVSLAHNGVLFLDEFAQMPRNVTEALRGPIEDRKVVISRLRSKVEFPASFMLVAAANPCPCGYYGIKGRCVCTPAQRQSYISRLSGPIMDRIDIQLYMSPVPADKLIRKQQAEASSEVAARILSAREIQKDRFAGTGIFVNSEMTGEMVDEFCRLSTRCQETMQRLTKSMNLSARAFSRILKLARTIADLDYASGKCRQIPDINPNHLIEAAGYRFLDKLL